jgi:hypothetical protein
MSLKEMTMRTALVSVVLGASLAACVSAPPVAEPPPYQGSAEGPEGPCRAEPGQRFLGSKASVEVGNELVRVTGAGTLRWVPPRTAVTMDFRADRLTVSYDDALTITRISCT